MYFIKKIQCQSAILDKFIFSLIDQDSWLYKQSLMIVSVLYSPRAVGTDA